MHNTCLFDFTYYDGVTMATNITEDIPYPHIRWNKQLCFTAKEMVRTFKMLFAIISSTNFWTKHFD